MRLTVDDYMLMPEDGKRYELVEGELIVSPSPKRFHQEIVGELYEAIKIWVRTEGLGKVLVAPLDYRIDDHNVVQPDILYLPKSHPQYDDYDALLSEPPGLVVEVLSPGRAKHDLQTKFALYQRAGVPCYWIADYDREIMEAWELKKGVYVQSHRAKGRVFSAPPFPKLASKLGKIFARGK